MLPNNCRVTRSSVAPETQVADPYQYILAIGTQHAILPTYVPGRKAARSPFILQKSPIGKTKEGHSYGNYLL